MLKNKVFDFLYSLVIAVILAVLIKTFLFQLYKIPTGSMKPNLRSGDYLLVKKFSYGYSTFSLPISIKSIKGRLFFSEPKRGDIIVFLSTKDYSTNYIKRLIGFPGDEIQVRQGVLYINGTEVKRNYVGKYNEIGRFGQQTIYDVYEEQLPNNVKYKVLSSNNDKLKFPNQTPVYKVPKGCYFFMGDNRDNSIDSRFLSRIGYIPEENLIGKAAFLYWSRDFSVWKFITHFETGRLFHAVH